MRAHGIIAFVLAASLVAVPPARGDETPDKGQSPGPPPIEARLLVPLSGTKTTLRLQVTNTGKPTGVYPPLVNGTTLRVTSPDGKTVELGRCEENRPPDALKSGESKSYDLDVADHVPFTQKGTYAIALTVNGVRSNEVLLAVDPEAQVRDRAEAFLKVLREKQWDKAAPFVIVSTGKHDAETRRRMGIAPDAKPEEVNAKVAAWFKALYEKGAKVGEVQAVKLDAKDNGFALVTYIHEDLDGFNMRQVGGQWYYTLEGKPRR
jgi:hypothetical protein